MLHLNRQVLVSIVALALLLCGVADRAAAQPGAEQSFNTFCSSWMSKLGARERHNLKSAPPQRRGNQVVIEYTGYDSEPSRCEARPAARSRDVFIGKLVYNERHYQKAGATATRALATTPRIVEQVEVMEIFRFDGSQWVY